MSEAEGADSGPPRLPRRDPASAAVQSTPLLLQGQDYHFRSSGRGLDFQERMFQAGLVTEEFDDPAPCVLVLARAGDMEMNDLSLALAEQDIRMVRIDADRCTEVALTAHTDAPLIEYQQWLLRPVLVWRRHFDVSAIPVDPTTVHGAYVREQWSAVANWLVNRRDWEQVNPPRETDHLDRLTQLHDARTFGLTTPRTVVTTMPGRSRPGGSTCIVKAVGHHMLEPESGAVRGLFPRPLDIRRSAAAQEPAPVLVQQHCRAEHELRAFVVAGEVFGYRVDKLDPAQLWVDPEAVEVRRSAVPPALASKLRGLCRYWKLQVAAFDLLVVDDDFVFLEVNVNCDWRWFECRAECQAVSKAVHSWVRTRVGELIQAMRGPATRRF